MSLPEHLTIIDAVCTRNPRKAEKAMQAHLTSVLRALTEFASSAASSPSAASSSASARHG